MRIVGVETSSRRGSVALLEGSRCVAFVAHEAPNSHAERILALIAEALALAGWSQTSLDRIAVGTGPGAFVGLRVGIALSEGLSIGLGRPLLGVSSLAAMLRAAQGIHATWPRVALLDAKRGELFAAAHDAAGRELLAPCAVPLADLSSVLIEIHARGAAHGPGEAAEPTSARESTQPNAGLLVLGEVCEQLALSDSLPGLQLQMPRGPEMDLPHARWVAEIARDLEPERAPAVPEYVRGPGATLPKLPPSPLLEPSLP